MSRTGSPPASLRDITPHRAATTPTKTISSLRPAVLQHHCRSATGAKSVRVRRRGNRHPPSSLGELAGVL